MTSLLKGLMTHRAERAMQRPISRAGATNFPDRADSDFSSPKQGDAGETQTGLEAIFGG